MSSSISKHWLSLLCLCTALCAWGCGGTTDNAPGDGGANSTESGDTAGDGSAALGDASTTLVAATFCGDCGHEKGVAECCSKDCETCTKCGLHTDSKLCCVLDDAAAGKDLCGKCGEIAGADQCCAEDAETCEKCNLHKGSPLCCKLTADTTETTPEG